MALLVTTRESFFVSKTTSEFLNELSIKTLAGRGRWVQTHSTNRSPCYTCGEHGERFVERVGAQRPRSAIQGSDAVLFEELGRGLGHENVALVILVTTAVVASSPLVELLLTGGAGAARPKSLFEYIMQEGVAKSFYFFFLRAVESGYLSTSRQIALGVARLVAVFRHALGTFCHRKLLGVTNRCGGVGVETSMSSFSGGGLRRSIGATASSEAAICRSRAGTVGGQCPSNHEHL